MWPDKDGYSEEFNTLQECVTFIERWAAGQGGLCRAWIDNRRVIIRDCKVYDEDGQPFCTNPAWHTIFNNQPTEKRIK